MKISFILERSIVFCINSRTVQRAESQWGLTVWPVLRTAEHEFLQREAASDGYSREIQQRIVVITYHSFQGSLGYSAFFSLFLLSSSCNSCFCFVPHSQAIQFSKYRSWIHPQNTTYFVTTSKGQRQKGGRYVTDSKMHLQCLQTWKIKWLISRATKKNVVGWAINVNYYQKVETG